MMKQAPHIKRIVRTDLEGFRVTLLFSDGVQGTVNLSNIFRNRTEIVQEILRGNLFSKCFIESGALLWPNGLELCPYALKIKLEEEQLRSRKTKQHSTTKKRRSKAA